MVMMVVVVMVMMTMMVMMMMVLSQGGRMQRLRPAVAASKIK